MRGPWEIARQRMTRSDLHFRKFSLAALWKVKWGQLRLKAGSPADAVEKNDLKAIEQSWREGPLQRHLGDSQYRSKLVVFWGRRWVLDTLVLNGLGIELGNIGVHTSKESSQWGTWRNWILCSWVVKVLLCTL